MQRAAIAVLDFGGQYAHLIATKVRALGVLAEIRDPDDPVETYRGHKGIILSGSPSLSAQDEDSGWSRGVLDLGLRAQGRAARRSEEHTSELQSLTNLVCRLLLEKKKTKRK